uniref:F-box domain-containing protein n=1 Tax=Leersia perrieri TaxID=77586 RepID=A0A0D9VIL4_9ORYZ
MFCADFVMPEGGITILRRYHCKHILASPGFLRTTLLVCGSCASNGPWHTVTADHHFMHTNFSRNRAGGHSIAGFFVSNELHNKFSYNPLRDTTRNPTIPNFSSRTTPTRARSTSCNELILCRRPMACRRYYVCNPATMRFVKIPPPPADGGRGHYLNLAYDPSRSPAYKIVGLGHTGVRPRVLLPVALMASGAPVRARRRRPGLLWNGSLVWLLSRSRSLLRFAVVEEELSRLPMPPRPVRYGAPPVDDRLHGGGEARRLLRRAGEWRWRAAGDCLEWRALYRVNLTRVKEIYPGIVRKTRKHHPICPRRARLVDCLDLWPLHSGKIMAYAVEDQEISVVWEDTTQPPFFSYAWFDFYPYSPGLFCIIANILTRLPPKELVRARVVCKQWHALTSEHHFVHTNLMRNNAGHPVIAGFFLNDEIHEKFSYNPLLRGGYSSPDLSFIPTTPDSAESKTYVTSSCHGLLLCRRRRRVDGDLGVYRARHYVCNPETTDFAEIDVPDDAGQYLNLAYDPSRSLRHYRIVARGHDAIRVYSSVTRSWRTAVRYDRCRHSPFAGLRHPRGVFWNGSMVWAMLSPRLLRFGVDSGELSEMPLPPRLRSEGWFHAGWVYAYVGESGGRLQVIGYTDEERRDARFDVLEMRRDEEEEWTVLYRVDLTRVKELHPDDGVRVLPRVTVEHFSWGGAPLHIVRGPGEAGRHGMLFLSVPGKIVCYDAESRLVSVVWEEEGTATATSSPSQFLSCSWFNFYAYMPSLLRFE